MLMAHSSVGEVVKPSHEPLRRIPQRQGGTGGKGVAKVSRLQRGNFWVCIYIHTYIYIMIYIYIAYIELNMGTPQQTNTAMEYPRFGDHVVRESTDFHSYVSLLKGI